MSRVRDGTLDARRMPAWRREAEGLIAGLLGQAGVPWIEWRDVPSADASRSHLVLSLVGYAAPDAERERLFAALATRIAPSRVLIVIDHNRPRRFAAALRALVGTPWLPGWSPAARWQRLAAPTARLVQAAGFRVEQLRLAADERIQIVAAIRA